MNIEPEEKIEILSCLKDELSDEPTFWSNLIIECFEKGNWNKLNYELKKYIKFILDDKDKFI